MNVQNGQDDNFADILGRSRGVSQRHSFDEEVGLLRLSSDTPHSGGLREAGNLVDELQQEIKLGEISRTLNLLNALPVPLEEAKTDAMVYLLMPGLIDHIVAYCDMSLPLSFAKDLLIPFAVNSPSMERYCEKTTKTIIKEIHVVWWSKFCAALKADQCKTAEQFYSLYPGKNLYKWDDDCTSAEQEVINNHTTWMYKDCSPSISDGLKDSTGFSTNIRQLHFFMGVFIRSVWKLYVSDSVQNGFPTSLEKEHVEQMLIKHYKQCMDHLSACSKLPRR